MFFVQCFLKFWSLKHFLIPDLPLFLNIGVQPQSIETEVASNTASNSEDEEG